MPDYPFIDSVKISGFRSLAEIDLDMNKSNNILIGSNGSGKSNLLRFFEMLGWMIRANKLTEFIERHGGADDQLHGGVNNTSELEAVICITTDQGPNEYKFTLTYAHPDRLVLTKEAYRFNPNRNPKANWTYFDSGTREAQINKSHPPSTKTPQTITYLLNHITVYQFHNTSWTSNFHKRWDYQDSNYLRSDGGNLGAILHRLEHEYNSRFELICQHIARVLPIFERFYLEESYGKLLLRWKAKGYDKTIGAHLTSDGSLRLFALITLLNLPERMLPYVLLLDEPELGLHPSAISLIGNMIKVFSNKRQVIIATQSPLLVDIFDLDEIIVLESDRGCTNFKKLNKDQYKVWLDEEYLPGELWQKNVFGGRP